MMMRPVLYQTFLKVVALLLIWGVIAACGGTSSQPTKPKISITSLQDGGRVNVNQNVSIAYEASDVKGIVQVEITINGQPVHVETVAPPVNVFSGNFPWRPENAGSYLIQLVTFNVDGDASDVSQVAVTVEGSVEPTEASPAENPTPTEPTETPTRPLVPPTPAEATPTPGAVEPTLTPTPSPTVSEGDKPFVTALVGLNVRRGPSTEYNVIGRLAQSDTAEITGRNEVSTWWQIVFITEGQERGWVAAGSDFSTATGVENVPVIAPPPLDGPNQGAENSEAATPSDPDKPIINSFITERDAIIAGEQVTLSWNLEFAQEAYLRYDGLEEGIVSPGSKIVGPNKDTVYTLVARNEAGETTAELTVRVSGPTPTPAIVWDSGRFSMIDGQTIDFDQGLVQDESVAGSDFLWDVGAREFKPRGGAVGTLLDKPYADITFENCAAASYGAPIAGVDGSQPIIGCYRTNGDRFGKFVISGWEVTGKVTIDWLTWGN